MCESFGNKYSTSVKSSPSANATSPGHVPVRDELSYLTPLGSENISAPYFKQCFFRGGVLPPRLSQTPCLPIP